MNYDIIESESDLVSWYETKLLTLRDELTKCHLQIDGMHNDIYKLLMAKNELEVESIEKSTELKTLQESYTRLHSDYSAQKNRCDVLEAKVFCAEDAS